MTKKVKTQDKNDVLSLSTPSQKDIPAFLEKVSAKIAELKGNSQTAETTSGSRLEPFGKIKDISSVEELIKAYSSVTGREDAYEKSAKKLDVNTKKYPFKLDGHTASAWKSDIQARLAVVKNKTEIEKLEKVKAVLEENLSQEAKLQNDLKKIQGILIDEL